MPEEKSPSGEVALGLKSVFDRIGEFFHVFDLSFFVAGVMTFGALAFAFLHIERTREFPFQPWVGVLAIVIACYVCGLVAFAAGRALNGRLFRRTTLARVLPCALAAHNLDTQSIAWYAAGKAPKLWWLYIRMWSEIIHDRSVPLVLHHLMRYWAMAATYDGVAFSFIMWTAALFATQFGSVAFDPIGHGTGTVSALLCVFAAILSFRRGASFYEYQIEDVVAHFAVLRGGLSSSTAGCGSLSERRPPKSIDLKKEPASD